MKRSISFMMAMIATLFYFNSNAVAQEVKLLFNGKDLSNWNFVVQDNSVPADQVYSVNDGIIQIKGTPLGYMYTKEKYGDYILHTEWRWIEAGESNNSGIFLLIETPENPFPNGIECQLAAGRAGDFILLNGSNLAEYIQNANEPRPKFPVVQKKNALSEKPAGEWNKADIAVKDGVITVYINDVYQNTGTNKVKTGYIGLQSEGKAVQFRNVTLRKW
ncbi:hypothetical protein EZS27_019677 [termite gut metagenome]|uniref:3-keto-alpha-glucoside-1,2-lyase/3-keto-2-hydroxy-glucal hydratase domain-containing protein n=1 Tax=termite gut metagenome TaxID=433724 RepID=A0A5J4REK6_9ZZZZ